ncbi:Autophagy-related protein 13 [Leucoagaricus sp. SymC.cos]|nr:Autophagy-related protein 13 [Leucoagaricus sp. SymC.cos]
MMEEQQQKTDQIAYHFYTKLLHDARVTTDSHSLRHDKWFNLESPDSDLFTKDARDLYKYITRHKPPPFELEVVLCIPELAQNQAVVYLPPSSSAPTRQPLEPTPELIVLEVWTVTLSGVENAGVTPPPIYKHGMALFRSIYTLLRTLPTWALYKRIRRRSSRAGSFSISLRLRPPSSPHPSLYNATNTLEFHQNPIATLAPIPTLTQDFPPVQLPPGTLTFSVTYLTTPCFEIDELESVLSSRFISDDVMNAGEGFVPTLLNKSSSRVPPGSRGHSPPGPTYGPFPGQTKSPLVMHKEPSENIAERFILPSKGGVPGGVSGSPKDPLARLRKESISVNPNTAPSPTSSPRQRKLSLTSQSSPSSSIISQGPFLTSSTALPHSSTTATPGTTTTTTSSPLPIRRPNLNPFKTNTISSPSNSSPSVSLRTGGGISNPTSLAGATGPPPPSPLSTNAPPPSTLAGGQPSSVSSTHSGHSHGQGGGGGGGGPSSPVPVPTRKRYSSSFGHRYAGSIGSNASGGTGGGTGTTTGTAVAAAAGKPVYLHTNPDEDDISIFVQEIDTRKPLLGRAREYQHISTNRSRSTSRTRTGGGLSTSPVVSPTMLQMRYQQQQREGRMSVSPPSVGIGGAGRMSTSPPNVPNVLRMSPLRRVVHEEVLAEEGEEEEGEEEEGEEEEEDEVTPMMRVLEELGSSLEFSGGSTIGGSSSRSGSRPRVVTSTVTSSSPINNNASNTYSPAHSELLKIHQRHSRTRTQSQSHSTTSSPSESPRVHHRHLTRDRHTEREGERERETKKLKRRTRVVSGAVGAFVLAVAGWRIWGGVAGAGGTSGGDTVD